MIGASGFVGTRLLDLLREEPKKYECKNIDLLPSHFFNDITVIGDAREQEQMLLCSLLRNTGMMFRRCRSIMTRM